MAATSGIWLHLASGTAPREPPAPASKPLWQQGCESWDTAEMRKKRDRMKDDAKVQEVLSAYGGKAELKLRSDLKQLEIENKKKNAPANGKRKFIVASRDSSDSRICRPCVCCHGKFLTNRSEC